ncbi:hypothetical protein TNCV_1048481 [Trichonephila clavipes]|nr:hypothetical protein TNCV_1048481 [Trichonephila clavipes]
MNLNPSMYLIYSLSSRRTNHQHKKLNPGKARSVVCCRNSQSRANAGEADHQHLFFPSVGIWKKTHLHDWHRSDRFFLYSGSECVKRHHVLPMKVAVGCDGQQVELFVRPSDPEGLSV